MGHMVGKDLYRKLGRKIDSLTARAPWNDEFYAILKELYTADEAEIAVKMPFSICTFDQVLKATAYDKAKLQKILDAMCLKGLVMDFQMGDQRRYMLAPVVIGIFEFTMMRTGENLNSKQWAHQFHDYFESGAFYKGNFGKGQKISPLRALPHEEAISDEAYVEILDYEKVSAIVEANKLFAVGICSCRHEKQHLGEKKCDFPLEICTSFGPAAEYMLSHNFGRPISKAEMVDNLARARETGLVLCADNVKKETSFICFCCGCCCNVMLGISRFGYPNTVVTSTLIPKRSDDTCSDCGTCVETCPIKAISAADGNHPQIDESICIGCGVCAVQCPGGALKLTQRAQRVLHPETTFQRVILQSLERGTLQNLLFSDPQRLTHKFMRGFVGAFLKLPPVKRSLMSDNLRSSFLNFMQKGT